MNLVVILIFLMGVNTLTNQTGSLILNFLKDNNSKLCFFLVCWKNADKLKMQKIIEEKLGIRVAFLPIQEHIIEKIRDESYSTMSFILDLSCEKSNWMLEESSRANKFRFIYSWLMISNLQITNEDIQVLFSNINLRIDMDVKVAVPKNEDGQYDIFEIYDPGIDVDPKINMVGHFRNGDLTYFQKNLSQYARRRNMSGVLLRTANTVNTTVTSLEIDRNYINELNQITGAFFTYNLFLFLCLKEMHNLRYNVTVKAPWSGNTSSGADGGIATLLYNNEIDFSIPGGFLRALRVHYFDFLAVTSRFSTKFFFRNPGVQKIGYDILKPFSVKTWYATVVSIVVITTAIKATFWIDNTFFGSRLRQSFFTSFVIIISILAQQGSAIVPHRVGGRIIFLTALIFSILIYNYYTSSLVSSLLSTSPPTLKTIRELYQSNLKVGIENKAYAITFILQEKDYYIQQLNRTKIYQPGPNFLKPEDGLARVKQGGFAYHTETATAYPIISRTFEQEQICDLTEIDFMYPSFLTIIVPKHSQYKEFFQISLLMMQQSGIFKRERDVWIGKPPECLSDLRVISVSSIDIFLIYMIFVVGIILALVILFGEIIWFKIKTQKNYDFSN